MNCEENLPDVILMDIHMPIMKGTEVTRDFGQQHDAGSIDGRVIRDNRYSLIPAEFAGDTGCDLSDSHDENGRRYSKGKQQH